MKKQQIASVEKPLTDCVANFPKDIVKGDSVEMFCQVVVVIQMWWQELVRSYQWDDLIIVELISMTINFVVLMYYFFTLLTKFHVESFNNLQNQNKINWFSFSIHPLSMRWSKVGPLIAIELISMFNQFYSSNQRRI